MTNRRSNNNNGKGKARRARQRQSRVRVANKIYKIPECTLRYAIALSNPFARVGGEVCVPDQHPLPSRKEVFRVKFSGAIGTSGYGFAYLTPRQGLASGGDFVKVTSSTSAGSGTTELGSFTNLTSYASNSTINGTTDIGDGENQWRYVAGGLRLWNTSNRLNADGSVTTYAAPSNSADLSTFKPNEILEDSLARRRPMKPDKEYYNHWRPTIPADNDYHDDVTGGNATNAIMLVGTAGNTFDGEAIFYYEIVGHIAGKTATHTDSVGHAASHKVSVESNEADSPLKPSAIVEKLKHFVDETSHVAEGFVDVARGVRNVGRSLGLGRDMLALPAP